VVLWGSSKRVGCQGFYNTFTETERGSIHPKPVVEIEWIERIQDNPTLEVEKAIDPKMMNLCLSELRRQSK